MKRMNNLMVVLNVEGTELKRMCEDQFVLDTVIGERALSHVNSYMTENNWTLDSSEIQSVIADTPIEDETDIEEVMQMVYDSLTRYDGRHELMAEINLDLTEAEIELVVWDNYCYNEAEELDLRDEEALDDFLIMLFMRNKTWIEDCKSVEEFELNIDDWGDKDSYDDTALDNLNNLKKEVQDEDMLKLINYVYEHVSQNSVA